MIRLTRCLADSSFTLPYPHLAPFHYCCTRLMTRFLSPSSRVQIAVFNRTPAKVTKFIENEAAGTNVEGALTIEVL